MFSPNSKFAPALIPMLLAALLSSACGDSTAPRGEGGSDAGSNQTSAPANSAPANAAPADAEPSDTAPDATGAGGPAVQRVAAEASTVSASSGVTPNFATSGSPWAAPGASPGYLVVESGAAYCSGMPVGRYINVGRMHASAAGGNIATLTQLVTADIDLYRWNGSTWVYQRTGRSSVQLAGVTSVNPLPAIRFLLSSAGYYHIMVRATWWVDLGTGSWVKKASKVYAFDTAQDYMAGVGTSVNVGYCRVY
jgi:hypothetical protein